MPKTTSRIAAEPSRVLITGVTRGLGRAMVDEFVRLGHTVFGCARTKREIEELTHLHPTHDFQTVNVASHVEVNAWAKRLLKSHGPPDFVLNNAAVINLKQLLWRVTDRDFSDGIDINLKGAVNVIRYFVPSMITRKRGVIVNFTSRWGSTFEAHMAPYCATKWAVVVLTRVLAQELRAQGIAVVGLNPGIVKTELLQGYLGQTKTTDMARYVSCFGLA